MASPGADLVVLTSEQKWPMNWPLLMRRNKDEVHQLLSALVRHTQRALDNLAASRAGGGGGGAAADGPASKKARTGAPGPFQSAAFRPPNSAAAADGLHKLTCPALSRRLQALLLKLKTALPQRARERREEDLAETFRQYDLEARRKQQVGDRINIQRRPAR